MQMSKALLQQQDLRKASNILQTLNKYINSKKTLTQLWYQVTYDIIKSISYMKILQVYTHTTKLSAPSETKISKPN